MTPAALPTFAHGIRGFNLESFVIYLIQQLASIACSASLLCNDFQESSMNQTNLSF